MYIHMHNHYVHQVFCLVKQKISDRTVYLMKIVGLCIGWIFMTMLNYLMLIPLEIESMGFEKNIMLLEICSGGSSSFYEKTPVIWSFSPPSFLTSRYSVHEMALPTFMGRTPLWLISLRNTFIDTTRNVHC